MSFYNMIHGEQPLASVLLAMLEVKKEDVPRYRDCYLETEKKQIIIYTRTGGGNRDSYEDENNALTKVLGYIEDYDNDFDRTFAHFCYAFPEKFKDDLEALCKETPNYNPTEAFMNFMKSLREAAT